MKAIIHRVLLRDAVLKSSISKDPNVEFQDDGMLENGIY